MIFFKINLIHVYTPFRNYNVDCIVFFKWVSDRGYKIINCFYDYLLENCMKEKHQGYKFICISQVYCALVKSWFYFLFKKQTNNLKIFSHKYWLFFQLADQEMNISHCIKWIRSSLYIWSHSFYNKQF